VITKADAVTTVNEKWSQGLGRIFGRSILYTPNGVEASAKSIDPRREFNISKNELIVIYVGALRKVKGADILAETTRITAVRDRPLRFLVVGPGDPHGFGLSGLPNVVCTGRMSPIDTLAVYAGCDIFVLPSRSEGRPNALLEAMASGLPSVATKLPGVEEVLTSESGILVHPEDAEGLASAICALADNPDLRRAMGEKAKERIEKLSLTWGASAANYLAIYERIKFCAA
jgi:glycosyltransferase involved in cell wall biosynthesis